MTKTVNEITIALSGRIDSDNASETERNILDKLEGLDNKCRVIFDAKDLDYISSAGLRAILRMKKRYPDVTIINANTGVYDILDTTGFTQMMSVKKAYREVSVDGCEEIGSGANGKIYRIDEDNVVKVYTNDSALDNIMLEREFARCAFILGIPTAISYDVVKVGDSYGSVFELLDTTSLSRIIIDDPEKTEWCVEESVKLLKKIHSTHVPEGKLPDARQKFRSWIQTVREQLPEEAYVRLCELDNAMPFDDHMIHGDFHTKNLMKLDDEVLLIDMETIATGHPVFEFAAMYDSYIGFSERDPLNILSFQGYDLDTAVYIWKRSLELYFGTDDKERLLDIETKSRIIGYIRMMDYVLRHKGADTAKGAEELEFWRNNLLSILYNVDTLLFDVEQ